jgi:hypothetical protein
MPWYFYSGTIPVPVQRIDGEIVSVAPRTYIEARPEAVRRFGTKMSRTAPPKGRPIPAPPIVVAEEIEITPSPMAKAIVELGVTRDPAVQATPVQPKEEESAKPRRAKAKLPKNGEE